ncbi:MAG: hypothetical protein ACRDDZ_09330 [Marinifilaceae bacterium]
MEKVVKINRGYKSGLWTWLIALAFLLAINISFTSCKNDDKEYYEAYGMVSKKSGSNYDIVLDVDKTLKLTRTTVHPSRLRDSMRVVVAYEVEEDLGETLQARVLAMDTILTKPILNYDDVKQDSIGYDAIRVTEAWIAHGFINVQFIYTGAYYPRERHMINLLKKTADDGKIALQFRHNAYNDIKEVTHKGHASFKIADTFGDIELPFVFDIEFNVASDKTEKISLELR